MHPIPPGFWTPDHQTVSLTPWNVIAVEVVAAAGGGGSRSSSVCSGVVAVDVVIVAVVVVVRIGVGDPVGVGV